MRTLEAPATRPIWTPPRRKVRWCPVHRRIVNMAAGDRMLDASGNQILDASGNVLLSDGGTNACCCVPAATCTTCSGLGAGTTPANWLVTFSSITLCSCQFSNVDGASRWYVPVGNINATWTLPQLVAGDNCFWFLRTSLLRWDVYTDSGCTNKIAEYDTMIAVAIGGGLFTTGASARITGSGSDPNIFTDTETLTDCASTYNHTNSVIGGCSSIVFGTGGTATTTPA